MHFRKVGWFFFLLLVKRTTIMTNLFCRWYWMREEKRKIKRRWWCDHNNWHECERMRKSWMHCWVVALMRINKSLDIWLMWQRQKYTLFEIVVALFAASIQLYCVYIFLMGNNQYDLWRFIYGQHTNRGWCGSQLLNLIIG